MATLKKKKAAGKGKRKKLDASKVRLRDLDVKKGKVSGGGMGGGFQGGFTTQTTKKV